MLGGGVTCPEIVGKGGQRVAGDRGAQVRRGAAQVYLAAAFLKEHLDRGCPYVFNDFPVLYYLTQCAAPSVYAFPNHLTETAELHALAVDTETEQEIQKALDNLVQGRTTIAIAHRLSTLNKADRLVVMERGVLVEQGTHDVLMAKQGAYWRLYEAQAKGSADSERGPSPNEREGKDSA